MIEPELLADRLREAHEKAEGDPWDAVAEYVLVLLRQPFVPGDMAKVGQLARVGDYWIRKEDPSQARYRIRRINGECVELEPKYLLDGMYFVSVKKLSAEWIWVPGARS